MFLGINMFLALLRAPFNPGYARAKMILSGAKNIFMPANVNSIVIFYLLTVVVIEVLMKYCIIHLLKLTNSFDRKFFNFLENCSTFFLSVLRALSPYALKSNLID